MLNSLFEIEDLFDKLFPITRSIAGKGNQDLMKVLSKFIPFAIEKIEIRLILILRGANRNGTK